MPLFPRQDNMCLLTIIKPEFEVICCGCGVLLLSSEPSFYGGVHNQETTLCLGCVKDLFVRRNKEMTKRKTKQEPEVTKLTEHMQQSHPLWQPFVEWCSKNHVDMEYAEDWAAWWDCYFAGAMAATEALKEHIVGSIFKHGRAN